MFQIYGRFVVWGHFNGASCLQHTRLFWHNLTFVNFVMNSWRIRTSGFAMRGIGEK
jgi:hypothetical protein